MGNGVSNHIRSNIVGYVALFVALSASAYALPGSNTVNSGDIVNNQVRSADIGDGQVATADLANGSVNSAKVANNSLTGADIGNGRIGALDLANGSVGSGKVVDNSLSGADVAESTFGQVPSAQSADTATTAANADTLDSLNSTDFLGTSAQAGGDLGGPLSNLQIAGNTVGTSEVADNSLTGGDIDESSLSGVVSGTGLVLTGSRSVTSAAGTPTILALPGWGDIKVEDCTPNAIAVNRSAATGFDSTSPSGTSWTIGGNMGGNSNQQAFSSAATPFFGNAAVSNANANEGLSVFLTRTDSTEVVSLWIGELTGNTTCEFHVQAVMSSLPPV